MARRRFLKMAEEFRESRVKGQMTEGVRARRVDDYIKSLKAQVRVTDARMAAEHYILAHTF
jgi:hypothetical protein